MKGRQEKYRKKTTTASAKTFLFVSRIIKKSEGLFKPPVHTFVTLKTHLYCAFVNNAEKSALFTGQRVSVQCSFNFKVPKFLCIGDN